MWVANGANWFFGNTPEHWNPWTQLLSAGLGTYVPKTFFALRFQANASVESSGAGSAKHFETIHAKNIRVALAA